MRKIMQCGFWDQELIALCDDGTLWSMANSGWRKLEPIPQDTADNEAQEARAAPRGRPPFRPGGYPVWCIEPTYKIAIEVPNAYAFRRWHNDPASTWLLVEATTEGDALKLATSARVTTDFENVCVDGQLYRIPSDRIPF